MFILHKGNNCTQRSLLNLDEQANYEALLFLPIAFSAVTKLHTKTWAFPQGTGFIYSNLCILFRAKLEDGGLQVALQFPRGRAWGIFVSFALSLQVCLPANHSTSPRPSQHLAAREDTTACQLTMAQNSTAAGSGVILWRQFQLLTAPWQSLPCLYCPAATLPSVLSTVGSAALPVTPMQFC